MQAASGLGKLIGQRRGDAVGRLKQTQRIELVEVANDKRHRHGFPQRAPQPEHDAAHHAGFGVGQHDLVDHFPGGGAQAVGRLLEQHRRDLEHVAHHRGNEGNDHDRQNNASRQNADANRRAGHQRTQPGHAAQQALQRLLHIGGQHRAEHQQAPHAVNDGRHGGQQLDGRAQRALEPGRRQLGQKQRNAKAHRHGNQERNERGGQRAVNHDQPAVLVLDRVPDAAGQKTQPVFADGRPGANDQRHQNAKQQRQRQKRSGQRGPAKQAVRPGAAPLGPHRRGRSHVAPGGWGRKVKGRVAGWKCGGQMKPLYFKWRANAGACTYL